MKKVNIGFCSRWLEFLYIQHGDRPTGVGTVRGMQPLQQFMSAADHEVSSLAGNGIVPKKAPQSSIVVLVLNWIRSRLISLRGLLGGYIGFSSSSPCG